MEAIIVGGGLSGLAAAWQLHRHEIDFVLLEARSRLGGRVLSIPVGDGTFDVGPSWVWDGQLCIAALLNHFGLSVYQQVCDGDLLQQHADGRIQRDSVMKPMQSARRITGGVGALVNAMATDLPKDRVVLESQVKTLQSNGDAVGVLAESESKETRYEASRVAVALPPRLAAELNFQPVLDETSLRLLKETPTWMAGHAKYFAFYETPFWRDSGLSGDALSRTGPLAEIHDASPESGGPYALMGFFGIDGVARQSMRRRVLNKAAVDQLVALFGEQAANPTAFRLVDWANEPFTAAESDRRAPDHHPQYGMKFQLPAAWKDRIRFISSESANENGGLLEGALQNGFAFANDVIRSRNGEVKDLVSDLSRDSHGFFASTRPASMSWDWIGE